MTTIIAHGLKFIVECDGFVFYHAEADRDAGIDAIQTALDEMPADRVAALHAASLAWVDADCDGERPEDMTRLERIGEKIATAGWTRPEAATMSLSVAR